MSKILVALSIFIIALLFTPIKSVHAIENPLAVANNKIGIHVLNGTEIAEAAKLVNSNGGDWGYVLIPIQAGDKNYTKWQSFMNECKNKRIIPIIRLATEGDAGNTTVWRKPNPVDVIEFATFLNRLSWPTKNRYVIVFNEVNRGDEWGGNANPTEYANLLSFASTVFKTLSSDFFIISAGLDNGAPDQGNIYIEEYSYLRQMDAAVPGIFNQIDGISSHSYPNPGFSQPPNPNDPKGVASFIYEKNLISQMSNRTLPIFITETGWSAESVPEDTRVHYYDETFKTIWNDKDIVAITPFLLQASMGPFEKFTFITSNGYITKQYQYIQSMPKIKGIPSYPTRPVAQSVPKKSPNNVLGAREFAHFEPYRPDFSFTKYLTDVLNNLIGR